VLALTHAASHDIKARFAFREELVFPEDVKVEDGFVSGAFHVDLLQTFEFSSPSGPYFLSASIGELVSEVVACSAEMPWLTPAPEEGPDDDEYTQEIEIPLEYDKADDDPSWMVDDPSVIADDDE